MAGHAEYARISDIFRSWFWRFYDNLFQLILLNLAWFLAMALTTILFWKINLFLVENSSKLFVVFFWYLSLCFLSIGWASIIFRVFNNLEWTWKDFWNGTIKYGKRAISLAAISGLVFLFAFLSFQYYSPLRSQTPFLWILIVGTVAWSCVFWFMTILFQWPILFFQDSPLGKTLYRSILLASSQGMLSLTLLLIFGVSLVFFSLTMVPWFFFGGVYFFSIQCVALEKIFLRHKIVLNDKPIEELVGTLDREKKRGWSDFIKPWENR